MSQNIQQTNMASLLRSGADDLLRAHQSLITAWFDDWVRDERACAQEVLRKGHQLNQAETTRSSDR